MRAPAFNHEQRTDKFQSFIMRSKIFFNLLREIRPGLAASDSSITNKNFLRRPGAAIG